MANTNKTKAEILQELESIKGLLLEEDDIPILQAIDETHPMEIVQADVFHVATASQAQHHANDAVTSQPTPAQLAMPGQTSLFEEESGISASEPTESMALTGFTNPDEESTLEKRLGFAAHLSPEESTLNTQILPDAARPLTKANGENPFLPQHIRERLRGNNPPPLFEYETAKKIINATKDIANKINKPRQTLVDDVINTLVPQIETELRRRLFAMSVEDLEKLLNEDED